MANSCLARYAFDGKKEEILELYKKLETTDDDKGCSSVLTGAGHLSLKDIMKSFGGNITNMHYNGFMESMEINVEDSYHPHITILTDTDCKERNEVWNFILKRYPSIKYYYIASEVGEEYYVTNDVDGKYFSERFVLAQDDRDTEPYETEDDFLYELSKRLGVEKISLDEIDDALDKFEEANEDHGNIRVEIYKVITNKQHYDYNNTSQ